jgi:hypothetical protein
VQTHLLGQLALRDPASVVVVKLMARGIARLTRATSGEWDWDMGGSVANFLHAVSFLWQAAGRNRPVAVVPPCACWGDIRRTNLPGNPAPFGGYQRYRRMQVEDDNGPVAAIAPGVVVAGAGGWTLPGIAGTVLRRQNPC